MNSSTTLTLAVIAVSCTCLMTAVTSSPLGPLRPVVALEKMEPDHACLFICSMCFPDLEDTQHLLDCSNKVCGPVMEGMCAMEKFIWLGHTCRHYDLLKTMWSATKRL